MAQQMVYVSTVLGGIDREIGAVEAEYKAALAVAAEGLQSAQRRSTAQSGHGAGGGAGGVLVEDPAAEINPEMAIALHKLETRLDQLKELRAWIKVDPELARFAAPSLDAGTRSPAPADRALEARAPLPVASEPSRRHGIPVALAAIVALLALVAGWLISLALPVAGLLPH